MIIVLNTLKFAEKYSRKIGDNLASLVENKVLEQDLKKKVIHKSFNELANLSISARLGTQGNYSPVNYYEMRETVHFNNPFSTFDTKDVGLPLFETTVTNLINETEDYLGFGEIPIPEQVLSADYTPDDILILRLGTNFKCGCIKKYLNSVTPIFYDLTLINATDRNESFKGVEVVDYPLQKDQYFHEKTELSRSISFYTTDLGKYSISDFMRKEFVDKIF